MKHQEYSSKVEIYLLVEGRKIPVAQVGPDTLILRDEDTVSGLAELVITVDGTVYTSEVFVSPDASSLNPKVLAHA